MKTMKCMLAVLVALFMFTSCEDDDNKIYIQSLTGSDLIVSSTEVVLSVDVSQQVVLSFAWTSQTISISDESVGTDVTVSTHLEASLSEDFSGTVSETETSSLSHAFTGGELNTVVNAIGGEIGQANTVYFRLGSTTGDNIPSAYSNVVSVSITPYEMDMTVGTILDSDKVATGETLYSANADGVYTGFKIASSWENFYMKEGDGTVWGNIGEDGYPFVISSESSQWNMWFPGQSGCYYVIIDTQEEEWSALYISSLSVSGLTDSDVSLTLDTDNNKWLATFTASAAGSRTITISGAGVQYNATTGDTSGESVSVALAMDGETLSVADAAGSITVDVPQTGTCTVSLDLSDPANSAVTVTAGEADIPVTYPSELKMISSDGTELLTLSETSTDGVYSATYTGYGSVNFNFVDEESNTWYGYTWTEGGENNVYQLVVNGNANLYFEDWTEELVNYVITVDLTTMTWKYEVIVTSEGSISMYKFDSSSWSLGDYLISLEETDENVYTGVYNDYYDFDFVFVDGDGTWYGTTWSTSNENGTALEAGSFGSALWIYNYSWYVTLDITITVDFNTMTWSYTEN